MIRDDMIELESVGELVSLQHGSVTTLRFEQIVADQRVTMVVSMETEFGPEELVKFDGARMRLVMDLSEATRK